MVKSTWLVWGDLGSSLVCAIGVLIYSFIIFNNMFDHDEW